MEHPVSTQVRSIFHRATNKFKGSAQETHPVEQTSCKDKAKQDGANIREANDKSKSEREVRSVIFTDFCKENFDHLRQTRNILDPNKFSFSDLIGLESFFTELVSIYELFYTARRRFQRHEFELFQRDLGDILLEINQVKLYEKILREVPKSVDFKDAHPNQITILSVVMEILHNCTDLSDSFAAAVTKTTIVKDIKDILVVNTQKYLAEELKDQTIHFIKNCHGIFHNTSMREGNIPYLRAHDLIPTLRPYLSSTEEMTRLSTLATLANIVTEEECDVITAHAPVVAQLLNVVQTGCDDEGRRCKGWSCKECVLAIRQLARNDANKRLLVELNTLPILVRMASTGNEEEQRESVYAILQISFDEFARKQIEQDPESLVMNLLVRLKDSPNKQIADITFKAIWNLREEFNNSTKDVFRNIATKLLTTHMSNSSEKQHIMISYQSENRDILVKIKDRLKLNGYLVWMDVEQMSGDILETMAQGVENAAIVLVCFSKKYKESDYCRQEAQYAHKLKKPIIPVKMEDGYEADGWLGFMLASEYYINFSGKYLVQPKTEEKIQDLFRQIERKWRMDCVDTAIAPTKVQQTAAVAEINYDIHASHGLRMAKDNSKHGSLLRSKLSIIRHWRLDEVRNWLKDNNLENCGFDTITGIEISLLLRMLLEVPDQFYKSLRHDLQIKTLVAKANFVWALEELLEKETHSAAN